VKVKILFLLFILVFISTGFAKDLELRNQQIVFITYQFADAYITNQGLKNGAEEANSAMKNIVGGTKSYIIKGIGTYATFQMFKKAGRNKYKKGLKIATTVMNAIVENNLTILKNDKKFDLKIRFNF